MYDLTYPELINVISFWGYPLMLLLMVIEGPIVTITAAFLSSLGIFNWVAVLVLSIIGDIVGDVILYLIGFFGGHPILERAEKLTKVKHSAVEALEQKFKNSGAKIIFSVKSTTGLSWITFILAGTVRMSFRRFLLFSFLGGIVWSSLLVGIGYFFGYAAEQIERYIKFAGWIIFLIAILVFVYIAIIKKRRAHKLFQSTKTTFRKINGQIKTKRH